MRPRESFLSDNGQCGSWRQEERGNPMVSVELIKDCFEPVVKSLGGRPEVLLAAEDIQPYVLHKEDALLSYRSLVSLFERASVELDCPDFGLRLAQHVGDVVKGAGPLEVGMLHSRTLRESLNFCANNIHVFTPAVDIGVLRDRDSSREYMAWELMITGALCRRQMEEYSLALSVNAARRITAGRVRPQEVWFTHDRFASVERYREVLGVPVKFNMPFSGLFYGQGELDLPVENRNPKIFEMAATYIEVKYPQAKRLVSSQVKLILPRFLASGRHYQAAVAEVLAMHPRTLQRRLKEEGVTFEEIVDEVRREIALRSLSERRLTLTQISEKLGYSESTVLSRSFKRWFACNPRQMRRNIGGEYLGGSVDQKNYSGEFSN